MKSWTLIPITTSYLHGLKTHNTGLHPAEILLIFVM